MTDIVLATTLEVVKAEFVELLTASTDLIDVEVTYGHPGNELANEAIWIGETSNWEHQFITIGNSSKLEETYDLAVRFLAAEGGQDAQTSDHRVLELFSVASWIVRDTRNFMDLRTGEVPEGQLLSVLLTPDALNPYFNPPEGRVAGINAVLRVKASI